jgi:voltage-gated potassium channel
MGAYAVAVMAMSQAERLERWERRTTPILTVAAILPIAMGLTNTRRGHPVMWLDLASWLVFIADYVVHLRLKPNYPKSRLGIFDLVIVVLTAPWYMLTGGSGRFLAIARLARLGRVFVASKQSTKLRELGARLGRAALYSFALMLVCALVVEAAEPASEGFVHYTDAMWWAVVTFTTVGYGDLYPTTSAGRVAAVFLMLGGVALIGSLAASLGSFLQKNQDSDDEFLEVQTMQRELLYEVRELRAEIAELRAIQDPSAE